jgi:glyoxylase I family protein
VTNPAVRFSHIGLCVADLDRSVRFYCDGLGFAPAEAYDLDDRALPGLAGALEVASPVSLRSQMITNGALKVELLAYATPPVVGSPSTSRGTRGLTHLAFVVSDVDATARRLVELGGTVVDGTDADLGIRLVFVADPDGTRVELLTG